MKYLLSIIAIFLSIPHLCAQIPNGEYKVAGYTTMNQNGVIDDGEFPVDAIRLVISDKSISVKSGRYSFYTWNIDKILDTTKEGNASYILYDTRNNQKQIAPITYQKEDSERFNRKCYLFNIFWSEERFDRLYIYKENR